MLLREIYAVLMGLCVIFGFLLISFSGKQIPFLILETTLSFTVSESIALFVIFVYNNGIRNKKCDE